MGEKSEVVIPLGGILDVTAAGDGQRAGVIDCPK